MRIGIDARSLQQKGTGVGRYLFNILKHYPELDKSNEYMLYLTEGKPDPALSGFNSKAISIPFIDFNLTWLHFRLPFEIAKDKIDLFHGPYSALPFLQPCPMVMTIHDLTYEIHPEWFSLRSRISFQAHSRWAVKTAKRIIAVSECTKKDIIKYYKVEEKNIEIIYLAPEESYKQITDKSRLNGVKSKYGISKNFLLHVGVVHARRNIERLLKVFGRLRGEGFDIQLVLVGSLMVRKMIRKTIDLNHYIKELGLEGEVIHIDYVPDEDLVCLYNAAKLFVYPSLYEGFGLPLVEAMACGTPVIASNVSSIPEVVGDAGILFDPYNEEEILDSIKIVLNDKSTWEALSIKGLNRAKQFSWSRAAKQTIELYNKAVK